MKRHEINKKRKDPITGKVFYGTILYPKIERRASDLYVESRVGDRLDLLANEFYKDVTLWWIIAQANDIGHGTMAVKGGLQLRIPMETSEILRTFNEGLRKRKI